MDSEKWDQLKNDIHTKCVAYDYSDANDSSLADFITNLVRVGKSFDEVNNELLQMIGGDYDSNVTEWLFTRKQELEKSQDTPSGQQPSDHEMVPEKEAVLSDQEEIDTSPKIDQAESEPQQSEQAQQPKKPEVKSRIFSHAIGALHQPEKRLDSSRHSRDRSRSPERRFTRQERQERHPRYEHRDEHRDDRRSIQIVSRAVRNDARPNGERMSVFDRLGPRPSQRSRLNGRDEVFERRDQLAQQQPQEQPDASQSMELDRHPESSHAHNKKERCKYWPTCKNGLNCPYFHPTRICPKFPNCPKPATECTFIHPETAKPTAQVAPPPMMAKIPVPCKFFPYCANPVCPYIHPVFPPQQQAAFFTQAQQRVPLPCKNGDACTRPDCHFLHPKDPKPSTDIICKYDGACTRPNCFYKHTKQNTTSQNKVLVNKPATSDRQFSVPEDQVEERIVVGESADTISQDQEHQPQEQQPQQTTQPQE